MSFDKINRKSFGQYIKKCRKAKNMKQHYQGYKIDKKKRKYKKKGENANEEK